VNKKNTEKSVGGRPKLPFDIEQFEELCKIQCLEEEIAAVMKMSVDTLDRNCKSIYNKCFADVFAEKRKDGKSSLRRKQYLKAINGDTTMLIWLGKNMLDQKDRQEIDQTIHTPDVIIKIGEKPDAEE
jgi:hypothetical protein